jgi:hypothetical protein
VEAVPLAASTAPLGLAAGSALVRLAAARTPPMTDDALRQIS